LLIEKRKFDIRVFALFTAHVESQKLRGYIFEDGYLRTCCKEYDVTQVENRYIHLTNDAVQKFSTDYGKYE
jgi:tubulin--tyrosine ligase